MEVRHPNSGLKWIVFYLGSALTIACQAPANTPGTPNTTPPVTSISEVVPSSGPVSGGTKVEIHGQWFDNTNNRLEVTFGDVVLVPDEISVNTLVVTTPEVEEAGPVTVRVQTIYGTATQENGFTYEALEDTYSVLADMYLFDVVNPDQFNPPATDTVDAFAMFVEPRTEPLFYESQQAMDSCEFNPTTGDYDSGQGEVTVLDAGGQVAFSGGSTVSLPRDSSGVYALDASTTGGYVAGGSYDLTAGGGSSAAALAGFSVASALETLPGNMTVNTPNIGFFDAMTGYTEIQRNAALPFTWSSAPGDMFVVELYGYDSTNGVYTDEVLRCRPTDDGSFTVPAGDISKFVDADLVLVYVGRATWKQFDFPPNDSFGHSFTMEFKVGVLQFPVM